MMKSVIGFEAFQALGFAPSRIPPWAGTLVGAAEVDEALAVTVEVTTWVMTLAMMEPDAMISSGRRVVERRFEERRIAPGFLIWRGQQQILSGGGCGNVRPMGDPERLLIADKNEGVSRDWHVSLLSRVEGDE